MKERVAISYAQGIPEDNWIRNSDYIFVFLRKEELSDEFWDAVPDPDKVYGIGTKNFGDSNAIIYNKRLLGADIHQYCATVQKRYADEEEILQKQWGDHYISLLSHVKNDDGTVNIFTDENKFLSYDCYHLSPAGARYFAEKVDWSTIFKNEETTLNNLSARFFLLPRGRSLLLKECNIHVPAGEL